MGLGCGDIAKKTPQKRIIVSLLVISVGIEVEDIEMGKKNEFTLGPSDNALKIYNKLIEKINAIDEDFKLVHHRDYDNILFHPHKRVALQLHRYHGHLTLAIPGSNSRFPDCDLKGVDVQALSGYSIIQNRFWLNATRSCWPPKPSKTFVVQAKQLSNSKVWYQIDRLLKFAKENCERFDKKH